MLKGRFKDDHRGQHCITGVIRDRSSWADRSPDSGGPDASWADHLPDGPTTCQMGRPLARWADHLPDGPTTSQMGRPLARLQACWPDHLPDSRQADHLLDARQGDLSPDFLLTTSLQDSFKWTLVSLWIIKTSTATIKLGGSDVILLSTQVELGSWFNREGPGTTGVCEVRHQLVEGSELYPRENTLFERPTLRVRTQLPNVRNSKG
jgi:hypothetical protein